MDDVVSGVVSGVVGDGSAVLSTIANLPEGAQLTIGAVFLVYIASPLAKALAAWISNIDARREMTDQYRSLAEDERTRREDLNEEIRQLNTRMESLLMENGTCRDKNAELMMENAQLKAECSRLKSVIAGLGERLTDREA